MLVASIGCKAIITAGTTRAEEGCTGAPLARPYNVIHSDEIIVNHFDAGRRGPGDIVRRWRSCQSWTIPSSVTVSAFCTVTRMPSASTLAQRLSALAIINLISASEACGLTVMWLETQSTPDSFLTPLSAAAF